MTVDNIILIGMPGAGKTTVGRKLAAEIGFRSVDTDRELEACYCRPLTELARLDHFLILEEASIFWLEGKGSVISTGGSVVYGAKAMSHLKSLGPIVHLHATPDVIAGRISGDRGIVRSPGQSLESLYEERLPLYRRWADHEVMAHA